MAKKVDWEAVERDYRIGAKTLREMADIYGISHVAIKQRADKFEWTRDLSEKIKQKTTELYNAKNLTLLTKLNEAELILTIAQKQSECLEQESKEIQVLVGMRDMLNKEFLMCEESTGEKARIVKNIVDISEKIINLRRRNLGINDNANGAADQDSQKLTRIEIIPLA